jgi:hypothetical protein
LVVKPSANYDIKIGTLTQKSSRYTRCDDSGLPKYTWSGSDFKIGPLFSSHAGEYLMRLQNNSNVWENRDIKINVLRKY